MENTKFVPAILEYNWLAVENKIKLIQQALPEVKRVQIDFADGLFVNNQTLIIDEIESLPEEIHFEAHLMLDNPTDLSSYVQKGFKTIIVHYESFATEQQLEDVLTSIRDAGVEPGLAINPETPVSVLAYFTDNINHFTLLSVAPGFQGNPFIPETFERVKELKSLSPHGIIEVDGSVNLSNALELKIAGASLLAVGSGLFETKEINQRFASLCEKIA